MLKFRTYYFSRHSWGRMCVEGGYRWGHTYETVCLLFVSEALHLVGNSLWWRHRGFEASERFMFLYDQSSLSQDNDESVLPWELYHSVLPPVCLMKDTGSNSAVIGAKIGLPLYAIQLPAPHFTLPKKRSPEMTKIIQSQRFHGFHLLLIASHALRGHSPYCRAGQGHCRLYLHNGPNSQRD